MGLYRILLGVLTLILSLSSCCKKTIIGSYLYEQGTGRMGSPRTEKHLSLNKDSTFSYNESFHVDKADDVVGPYYYYLGKGKYTIKNRQLTLHFESKFRKIGEIKVEPLSQDEITNFENRDKTIQKQPANSVLIALNFYFKDYPFENLAAEVSIGTIRVNEEQVTRLRNNILTYPISKFPLTLTFDFGKFNIQSTNSEYIERYWDYQQGEMYRLLEFNFGFLDETVNIEKPGNYKINIYPFKSGYSIKEDQVFSGQRVLPIKRIFGGLKIGQMAIVRAVEANKLK